MTADNGRAMSLEIMVVDGRRETWRGPVIVCAEPDPGYPDGICGMPVESQPCNIHHPDAMDTEAMVARAGHGTTCCGVLHVGPDAIAEHLLIGHGIGPVGTVWPQAEPETRLPL